MKNDSKTCLCEVIPMHLILTAADKSDVGKQREQNEDCAYKRIESSEEGDRGLFIVADGMGGYHAGEVASRLAVETIGKTMDNFFKPLADQTTIRLTASSSKPLDPDATVKLRPPGEGANSGESSTTQKTRKLPETFVSKSIEDQLTAAIQQANKAILRYGEQKTAARGLGCTVTTALIQNDQAYIANVGDSRTYLLRNGELKAITKDHS